MIPDILTRTSPRRARWLWASGLLIALATLIAAACGGDGQQATSQPTSTPSAIGEGEIIPIVVSSDLAVGPNRFVLGLLQRNQEVLGVQVHLRFFQQEDETPKTEVDATPIRITKTFTETHADGSVHTHETGETGVYVANLDLDASGRWRVEVTVTADGNTFGPLEVQFDVRGKSLSPAIGDSAPRSHQLTLADVGDIEEIDTSDPPDPHMHTTTIADAVTSGKPVVIAFATPAFCVSRICGPAKQVMDQLYEQYKGRVTFIHVEPYFIEQARQNLGLCPVPTFNLKLARKPLDPDCPKLTGNQLPPGNEDWGLATEPWVFVIDDDGKVAAKFESMVAADELDAAIQQTLASGGGRY